MKLCNDYQTLQQHTHQVPEPWLVLAAQQSSRAQSLVDFARFLSAGAPLALWLSEQVLAEVPCYRLQ